MDNSTLIGFWAGKALQNEAVSETVSKTVNKTVNKTVSETVSKAANKTISKICKQILQANGEIKMFDAAFLFEGKNTKKAKLESAILNCVSIETASSASANSETASPAAAIETASAASANSAAAETSRDSKVKKIAKKVLSVLLSVFLVLSTVLCILVAVNNANGNDSFFGYGIYYVVTGSMEPTIHVGAAILVKENESQIYQVGDIVTFTSANPEIYGKPNTHRIIAVDESTGVRRYMTQGDANNVPDAELITANSIRGKMVWSTESLVWIATLMGVITTPMGFISMVLLPVLLIVVNQMKEFTRDFKDAVADAASEYAVDPANAGPANETRPAGPANGTQPAVTTETQKTEN